MQQPLESRPGERFNYSNSGYLVLGDVIEKLTGQSYETFIRDTLLNPLGMRDTGLDSPAVIPRRAGSYTATPNGLVNASYASDRIVPNSAAGMYSTTGDLLRWQNALYGGRVLSSSSLAKMTTAGIGDYGLGIYLRTIAGRRAASHGGGAPPFATLSYFFDSGISVIVLGNLSVTPSAEIASNLAALAHGDKVTLMSERREVALAPTVLARYAGTYRFGSDSDIAIAVEAGHLILRSTAGQPIVLLADSPTRFFHRELNMVIEFHRAGSGEVTGFTLLQAGREQTATRVK
jgi:CubicO group peptidase (beta-lactamase class C family)